MASLSERASIIPGKSLTRSKALFNRHVLEADGAVIMDTDGRAYIDMLCALGAISLGYERKRGMWLRPWRLWQRIRDWYIGSGVYSLPHPDEVLAAEAVLEHLAPWASWVRFTKTGSEATHAAYRIAKATTGREYVYVGDWAYHGWHEWCQGGDATVTFEHGCDMSLGFMADTAAVFIEPHRWETVDVEWLKSVRAFCDRTGALLVFDSMIYGGRFALGGTSEYFGVTPDLECYGKAIGNGQAVACVVGTDKTKAHGEIPSGTYSGDVVGLSAVIRTLKTYTTEPVIETLWARGRELAAGLDALVSAYPQLLKAREGEPVHQRLVFHDPAMGQRFAEQMWERGVLWHPGCANVMAAPTPEQIAQVIAAAAESLETLTCRVSQPNS